MPFHYEVDGNGNYIDVIKMLLPEATTMQDQDGYFPLYVVFFEVPMVSRVV
jgi:hypothetical protein